MAIFNSYVSLPEANCCHNDYGDYGGPDTFLLRGRHRAQSAAGPARRCPGVNGHQLQKRYIYIYSISYHIISYLSTNIYIYINIYTHMYTYIYTYVYIYIYPYTPGTWMYMVSAHGTTIKHNTIRPLCFFLECHTCSPGISWDFSWDILG